MVDREFEETTSSLESQVSPYNFNILNADISYTHSILFTISCVLLVLDGRLG